MLVTLGVIEAGIWLHGRNVAQRAATVAVDSARGSYGSVEAGRQAAEQIARSGGLGSVEISVTRGAQTVVVTVRAKAPVMVDLGLGRVAASASAPIERVTQP